MNAYKYKAYIETKKEIAALNNKIKDREAAITVLKNDITQIENEISELNGSLELAINFKNELEKDEIIYQ